MVDDCSGLRTAALRHVAEPDPFATRRWYKSGANPRSSSPSLISSHYLDQHELVRNYLKRELCTATTNYRLLTAPLEQDPKWQAKERGEEVRLLLYLSSWVSS